MPARFTTFAILAALVSTPAIASGEFEYTISEPTTSATTFGTTTYTATSTQGQLDVYQTQPVQQDNMVYTTGPIGTAETSGFGELVYDTQPYFANGTNGSVQGQTYTGTTTYMPVVEPETDASWK